MRVLVLLLFMQALSFAQHSTSGDVTKTFSFDDPKYRGLVIAKVGDRVVTAHEFLLSYAFGPAFTKREKDSREQYLKYMVYEKLLALDGYSRHLDTTDLARQTLAEIEGDLATEELYKDDVLGKVKIPEKHIREGMKKEGLHLTVKWLYSASKEGSERLKKLLDKGIPFDTLYTMQLNDSVKAADRSMETTRFRIAMKNPDLARVIDTLHTGNYSKPVKAPDGYYIVKTSDAWTNAIMTETEETKLHTDIERALVEHESDSLSDFYVKQMIEGKHPTIIRKPADILQTHFARIILPPEKFAEWKLTDRLLKRWGPVNDSDLTLLENESLVQLTDHKFTVKDFVNWYHAREENLKFNSSSPQSFFEQMVWQMVRDRLLTMRALARGLQKKDNVRNQKEWWKDKIVYKLVRGTLADSIELNDSLLHRYYGEHQKNYRSDKGEIIPFEKAKEDVRKDSYSDALTARLLHRILKLKEKYKVEIMDDRLKSLDIDEDINPKAIDVYVVKKGGTFLRQAFPSIDYEWQAWN
jgi:hypothetical protein